MSSYFVSLKGAVYRDIHKLIWPSGLRIFIGGLDFTVRSTSHLSATDLPFTQHSAKKCQKWWQVLVKTILTVSDSSDDITSGCNLRIRGWVAKLNAGKAKLYTHSIGLRLRIYHWVEWKDRCSQHWIEITLTIPYPCLFDPLQSSRLWASSLLRSFRVKGMKVLVHGGQYSETPTG